MFSVYWLFLLTPISVILNSLEDVSKPTIFFLSALAIIPIAKLLVESTEQLAHKTGDAVGGLLNATFGNAPELIIAFVALQAGLDEMVKASIIGAILVNLLFAQGLSYFLGGIKYKNQEYNPQSTRIYSSMMMIAIFSLAIPSAFSTSLVKTGAEPEAGIGNIGLVIALLLLLTYCLYLFFMLKTHPDFFKSHKSEQSSHQEHEEAKWGVRKSCIFLVASSILAAFVSEILVGAAEETGKVLGMSETFMGLFCLAAVGGVAEIASAVSMARKDRMDLSIGISLGSSIQIALFVAPVLVVASYFVSPTPLELTFSLQGLGFLLLSVVLASMVSGDGKSNWFKGAQLLSVYFMLALMVYFFPS